MVEVDAGGELYRFDTAIAPEEARRIFRYRQAVAGTEWRRPHIYAVPGRGDRFVVSDNEPPDTEHFGLRLYLIAKSPDGFEQLSKTSRAGDSYNFTPTFLTGAGRTFILAEIGTEYSWGLLAYELLPDRLDSLGPLNVAVDSGENPVDPTPYARATLENGSLVVAFDTDLVFDPGGLNEKNLARRDGAPLIFKQEGDGFVLLE